MYNCKIRTYQEVSAVGAIGNLNWHGLTFKTEHDMINFLLKWS